MKYLINVIAAGDPMADDGEMAAIDAFNDRVIADGYWVLAGGLGTTDTAVTIDNRSNAGIVTDGPFAETAEFVAGFWVFDVPDHATALRLAREGSKACNRKVELRPFLTAPVD